MWLNGGKFLERQKGDTYQFRLIVAPEDAGHMAALKPFVRDLMRDMEKDLATRLDWVAADHFNTGHPHTHIIIAGHDDRGEALVMARHYILMSQVKHNARDNSSPAYRRGVGYAMDRAEERAGFDKPQIYGRFRSSATIVPPFSPPGGS